MATFDSLRREFRFHDAARKLLGKTALLVYGLISFIFFGDVSLSVAGSMLHYLVEVLEMLIEHFLEATFHVSTRTAQVITAWLGLSVFSALAVIFLRRAVRVVRKQAEMLKESLSRERAIFNIFRTGMNWSESVIYVSLIETIIIALLPCSPS